MLKYGIGLTVLAIGGITGWAFLEPDSFSETVKSAESEVRSALEDVPEKASSVKRAAGEAAESATNQVSSATRKISFDPGESGWPEIHCKHFFHGYPLGTPSSNDLIIRDIYALSSNDRTKFADWVAYRLTRGEVEGSGGHDRDWEPDPWLEDDETLEPADYKGAHAALKTDRGHQAPLASFRGTGKAEETNYLSNITPQRSELNQGPWRLLEEAVRGLVEDARDPVYVMTGPVYESESMELPEADEKHRVPSGYWKIVCVEDQGGEIDCAAFYFDQETPRNADYLDHLTTIDEIEKRSGLDFLSALPNDFEDALERQTNRRWAEDHLD